MLNEKAEVVANCDHPAKLRFSKVLPYAFTKHGAIQAASVLASPQVVEMGIFVVRTFVRMWELAAVRGDLAKRPFGFVTPADPRGRGKEDLGGKGQGSPLQPLRQELTLAPNGGVRAAIIDRKYWI